MIQIAPEKRLILWLLLATVFIGLFILFQPILTPFILGALIAYLLNPLVDRMQRLKYCPRWLACLVAMIGFFGVFFLSLGLAIPMLYREGQDLVQSAPEWLEALKQVAAPYIEQVKPYVEDMREENQEPMLDNLPSLGKEVGRFAGTVFGTLLAGGQAVMGVLSLMFLMPIVTFYLLYDWKSVVGKTERLIPRKEAPTIHTLIRDINNRLAGFFRGQLSVCVILSIIYVLALLAVGLNFAVLIGLAAGMLSFIPFVGSLIGLVAATATAWFQFGDLAMVGLVLGIFMAGQVLEGNVLTPKLVGDKVGLHPLWVIFALMAWGSLFGFVGMLVALPVAAVIGVLVRFVVTEYTGSAAYKHGEPVGEDDHGSPSS